MPTDNSISLDQIPSGLADFVTEFVTESIEGTKWKDPVLLATTANITLSGEQTIDGVLTSGNRVLVKDQSAGAENGIYVSASGTWSRADDFNESDEIHNSTIWVSKGTDNADRAFTCITDEPITVGTTVLTFIHSANLWNRNNTTGTLSPSTLTDKIGIGLNTPLGKVHIRSAIVGDVTADPDADELILENNGNVDYTIAPTISIPAPSAPVTSTGTAVLDTGVLTVTTGLPSGTGYTEGETVNLTGTISSANDARGTITVTAGVIQTITITNIGSGYSTNEALTIVGQTSGATDATATSTTTQFVDTITVDISGQGYTSVPTVTINDSGSGTGATATAILVNTKVTAITVTAGGTGYTSGTVSVVIADPPTSVTATGTVTISGGKVTTVTITNAGSGYFNPPPLPTISGGDGTGAGIDTVTLSLGTISSITVTEGGTGMTFLGKGGQLSVFDFGHPATLRHGRFVFDHGTERFRLITNGVQGLIIDVNANVAVSASNTDFSDRFVVRSDVSDIESKISIGDNVDRLKLGYDGSTPFANKDDSAQVIVQQGSKNLTLAGVGNGTSSILFYTSTSAGAGLFESMRIVPGGRLAIGLTDPDGDLHIAVGRTFQIGAKNSANANRLIIDSGGNIRHTFGLNDGSPQSVPGRFQILNNVGSILEASNDAGGFFSRAGNGRWGAISGSISGLGALKFFVGGTSTNQLYDNLSALLGMTLDNAGSLTVTKNLTVDTNTLFVDADNDRLGVNILSPTEALHVVGNGLFTGTLTSSDVTSTGGSISQKPKAPEFEGVALNDTNLDGANGVFIHDHYAIVVSSTAASLSIIDIKDPDSPVRLGTTSTDTRLAGATNVFVVGNIAYVTAKTENRLVAVSIENKSTPTILGSLQDNTNFLGIDGIFVKGQYAYVTATTSNIFAAIDISNPAAMVSKGTFTEGTFQNYVGVYVKENLAFITSRNANAVLAINIEDVTSMSLTGSFQDNTNLLKAESITVSGKYAYVVSSTANSLTIINTTNPASMTLVGTTGSQTSLTGAKYLAVAGEYAYATSPTNDTITTIDLTTIATPTILGSLVDGTNIDGAAGIAVAGTFAYVAGPTSKSLAVYNIHGLNTSSATIGTAQIGTLYVTENAIISNSLHTDSLNVANNTMIGGQLSMVGMLFFDDFANFTHTDPTLNLNIKTSAFGGLNITNVDGSVFIGDGTAVSDAFLPFIRMRAKNSLVGANILGQIPDADDTGDIPVMIFNARNLSNAAITTRPIFSFRNAGIHVWTLDADGITHESVQAGITAFATGGQASATLLTKSINEISTVATAADSVKLHTITTTLGETMTVINNGANAVDVFPNTGHFINGLAVNVAFSIAAGSRFIFKAYSSTKWVTF